MTLRVALTMRVTHASRYHEPRDSISQDWIAFATKNDLLPFLIPNNLFDISTYVDAIEPDLLILTGGDDVGIPPERHSTEAALLHHATTRGLPILGVCRGMQMLVIAYGGDLSAITGHAATSHDIETAESFRLIYGERIQVNSFHNTGVALEKIGFDLTATAFDTEGWVEAFVHDTLPIAGVMWHPERPNAPSADIALIRSLAAKKGKL